MFMMIKISTYKSVKVKHDGIRGWGVYGLNGWGSYGKVSCCFWEIYSKEPWSSGEYPFWSSHDHGFGPFELPTRGLLQKGRDHSPPKFCFVRSPASWFAQLLLWACIYSAINVQITKQIGGGVNAWNYYNTRGTRHAASLAQSGVWRPQTCSK